MFAVWAYSCGWAAPVCLGVFRETFARRVAKNAELCGQYTRVLRAGRG